MEEQEESPDVKELRELLGAEEPEIAEEKPEIVSVQPEARPEEVTLPAPTPDIKTRIYANYPYLKEFTDADFNTQEATLIDLNREKFKKGFWFIVFIDESQTGKEFLQRWLELAQFIKEDYLKLAYCNLTFEKKIFNNFKELGKIENIDHPFSWAKYVQVPFILTYRNSWPQGFYTGEIKQQDLINYIIDEASNPLVVLSKENIRRKNNIVIRSEEKLEKEFKIEDLRNRAFQEDKTRKEKLKNTNFQTQEISEGFKFND